MIPIRGGLTLLVPDKEAVELRIDGETIVRIVVVKERAKSVKVRIIADESIQILGPRMLARCNNEHR